MNISENKKENFVGYIFCPFKYSRISYEILRYNLTPINTLYLTKVKNLIDFNVFKNCIKFIDILMKDTISKVECAIEEVHTLGSKYYRITTFIIKAQF